MVTAGPPAAGCPGRARRQASFGVEAVAVVMPVVVVVDAWCLS